MEGSVIETYADYTARHADGYLLIGSDAKEKMPGDSNWAGFLY
jgi:hypothetical protein